MAQSKKTPTEWSETAIRLEDEGKQSLSDKALDMACKLELQQNGEVKK